MKGILIKGMEMPEFCTLCPCSAFLFKKFFCAVMGPKFEITGENIKKRTKPSWCPLMETEVEDELE